ncbi:stage v sporulation s [Micractinium conductrix]|uniref:Stage v sporulation s n=1 Tax=Micractinium conductrix TaxID=554055 RepID=A0A2P6VJD9_9CHLO|nr:stage v sporulation s [Micractinium conductrix]|eukprot:PSC74202.1 stage v sporulation s [Micractinium conductrix]
MAASPPFGGGGARRGAEDDAALVDFIKISSKEEPRHYSAKIAWNARNNSHMPLLATGAPAINCAIKAVAIARRLLEEDSLELFVQPAFRDRSMANSLALYVTSKSKRATEGVIQNPSELTAGKGSKPTVVAGAISNRAREGGCPNITGIGPEAVCNAIMAVCHARLYLEQDHLDIRCIPSFQEVEKEDRSGEKHTMTAVKLQVVVEKV